MFDIGFIEIMIVSMVALIVIGPERLPHVARTAGHLLGRLRHYVSSVKNDIQNEIRLEELRSMHASIKETTDSIENSVRQEVDQLKSMTETGNTATPSSATHDETSTDTKPQAGITGPSKPQSQTTNPEKQQNNSVKDN
ncbi:MAG: Sec-independent protein translocase protein TatB [Nitrosomonas sp.]|jgi:sec-independent protein translocase protein TatB|nr:MAG: Sec-independent protein translocase protein TatB [Nitrosomonas sp.]